MRFSTLREALLEPLQSVSAVVERRQTLPVLSNLLIDLTGNQLRLTGTDQEVELSVTVGDIDGSGDDSITVPARKFLDIWRSLPDKAEVECALSGARITIQAGRFKSQLATLPADDFPQVDMGADSVTASLPADRLDGLLKRCSFAMAQQDVRYFFNGMLLEVTSSGICAVATNGQRLAMSTASAESGVEGKAQFIIPRKGIIELGRLLPSSDETVELHFSSNHMRAIIGGAMLTTKLIDGTYPDYTRAIPAAGGKLLKGNRLEMREALSRTAILSNEVYRNIRLALSPGSLTVRANNPLQEEAEEVVAVEYDSGDLEIGFNVGYLIDVLNVLAGDSVQVALSDANSAALVTDPEDEGSMYVVSPMML